MMIHPRKNPLLWFDLLLVGISYVIVLAVRSFSSTYFSRKYLIGLGVFVIVWFTVTAIARKFKPSDPPSDSVSLYIIIINIIIFGIIAILMYGARSLAYSRKMAAQAPTIFGENTLKNIWPVSFLDYPEKIRFIPHERCRCRL